MRKPYKAAEWALEAKKSKVFYWNVWVLLAMPAVYLAWSLLLFVCCIMAFVWRTGIPDPEPDPNAEAKKSDPVAMHMILRTIVSFILALGLIYGALIVSTFQRYGTRMDKAWMKRIDGWVQEKKRVKQQIDLEIEREREMVEREADNREWNEEEYVNVQRPQLQRGSTGATRDTFVRPLGLCDPRSSSLPLEHEAPVLVCPLALTRWYGERNRGRRTHARTPKDEMGPSFVPFILSYPPSFILSFRFVSLHFISNRASESSLTPSSLSLSHPLIIYSSHHPPYNSTLRITLLTIDSPHHPPSYDYPVLTDVLQMDKRTERVQPQVYDAQFGVYADGRGYATASVEGRIAVEYFDVRDEVRSFHLSVSSGVLRLNERVHARPASRSLETVDHRMNYLTTRDPGG
ncbi:hypothetical protein NMY22_g20138 [Coprinellus aureogranulatus]|nr:hypothetical protein NMY22_g20138 [Coprinellus aureogranulatus]